MNHAETLSIIRNRLFHGLADYTKNQPDLFVPHRFTILAPSQVDGFIEKIKESLTEDELLVYAHFPFCSSECLFCNSFPHKTDRGVQQEYANNMLKEIELMSNHGIFAGKKARCISLGGGTPTAFPNKDIGRILDKISTCVDLSDACNITAEAHPATLVDKKRIKELRAFGINRISIGCQTFDQNILRLCNRSNTEVQIAKAVGDCQDLGMSINIDMMTGLPGQTMQSIENDLEILERTGPDSIEYIRHEIVNPLIVKLYRDRPELVIDNDAIFEMVYSTQEWMSANGYEQNGRFQDDTQWPYRYHWLKEMPIIAFGARTRSYTRKLCFDKYEELAVYSSILKKGGLPIGRYIALSEREQMYRSLLLNVQIAQGLNIEQFQERFAISPLEVFFPLLAELHECGCLQPENGSIRLSKYGAYFVEDVCDHIIDAVLKEESTDLISTPL